MAKGVSGKGSGSGSGVWNFVNLIKLIFSLKGTISITLILIFLTSISALSESIDQKSFAPFFKKVGGEILNHDNKLYIESVNIEENGGLLINSPKGEGGFVKTIKRFWSIIKSLANVLTNLWYLWTFAILFYSISVIFFTNNESAKLSNFILTLLLIVVLQIGANFIIIDENILETDSGQYEFTTKEKFMPFKGLIKFTQVMPQLFNPVYSDGNDIIGNNQDNQSNSSNQDSTNSTPQDEATDQLVATISML